MTTPSPTTEHSSFADQLRSAVQTAIAKGRQLRWFSLSAYEHMQTRQIQEFLNGKGINISTADRMIEALGMDATLTPQREFANSTRTDPATSATTLTEQLRTAVQAAVMSHGDLRRFSVVAYKHAFATENVERFLSGKGINLRTAEKLIQALGLEVTLTPRG